MSTVTEGDLRELKDLINNRFNDLEKKIDVYIAKTDEQLKGIEKRLDDNNTRLNTLTFGIFGVIGVFATGLLGIFSKLVFTGNP